MIFETTIEIVTSIGDEGCPFFSQCVGVGLVVWSWDLWDFIMGAWLCFYMGRTFQGLGLISLEEANIGSKHGKLDQKVGLPKIPIKNMIVFYKNTKM